jgi:hypothetical protein
MKVIDLSTTTISAFVNAMITGEVRAPSCEHIGMDMDVPRTFLSRLGGRSMHVQCTKGLCDRSRLWSANRQSTRHHFKMTVTSKHKQHSHRHYHIHMVAWYLGVIRARTFAIKHVGGSEFVGSRKPR